MEVPRFPLFDLSLISDIVTFIVYRLDSGPMWGYQTLP